MKNTIHVDGFEYEVTKGSDGKFTLDGYDFFDNLNEVAAEIRWQMLWSDGLAHKQDGKWVIDATYILVA